ncbi:PTS sugar transporter subunit IIA [Clostridium oceanicum]|uniref:PTS sugar transporter subunit IIA n=1 Tax=Clostridium oceanicum TaxID=1543 RepID=A0ABP3UL94_9CLOT
MKKIIIVSHGTIAKGIYEAATMIYGELKDVEYLCLEKDMGIDTFKEKLEKIIEEVKEYKQIIAIADLKGGSPYTTTISLLSDKGLLEKSKIISGLNLPMILSLLFMEGELSEDNLQEVISQSKDGISKFQIDQNENDEL